MKFEFLEVGGAVRDKLLGLDPKDIDFVAVPSDFTQDETAFSAFMALQKQLGDEGFELCRSKPKFFTVKVKPPKGHRLAGSNPVVDVVLARKDGPSSDGRHPDFVVPGSLLDDLARRDFTINAMAISANGDLIDPFNGKLDLKQQMVRFVGDPEYRIKEDGLRVLRCIRFSITKGFDIHEWSWDSINTELAAEMIRKVSIERVHDELKFMFEHNTLGSISLINDLEGCVKKAIFRDNLRLVPTLKH